MSVRLTGVLQVLLSGVCFGFLGVFGREAFKLGLEPRELLGFRFLLASVLLFLFVIIKFGLASCRISRKQLFHFFLLGVFGYAVFSSFYFIAIQSLSITLAVLLLYTFPLWVTLGAWLFLKEALSLRQAFIVPVAFIGLTLLIGFDFQVHRPLGFFFGFASAITYSVYILLSRSWLQNVNSFVAVACIQFFAGLALFLSSYTTAERTLFVLGSSWHLILGLALVCSVLAMTLFQSGLQKIQSWEASLLSTTEPLVGIALAAALYGEHLSSLQAFGAFLVLLSFILISWRAR